eukprot:c9548_g1_i3.p1 GENE.c9548_g1_i3~~c9548_g1_i3.p1  ORF type:complete len:234 (+),score=34.95 c9548_g1_i3:48-704(+)
MNTFKCVVVGDAEIGKICVLLAFLRQEPIESDTDTVYGWDPISETVVTVDGEQSVLSIWSIVGQEEYNNIRKLNYPQSQVFLLGFSVKSWTSFQNAESVWASELRYLEPKVPIILFASHCESRNDPKVKSVPLEEGQRLANRIGAKGYIEVSARTQTRINELFEMAVRVSREKPEVPVPFIRRFGMVKRESSRSVVQTTTKKPENKRGLWKWLSKLCS